VIQGSGKCSIKLKKTGTPLAAVIPGHAKARVDGIELIQDGEDLIAYLMLGIDAFEVNSFFLPDPPRIVLDVYRLQAAPKKTDTIEPTPRAPDTPIPHKQRLEKKNIQNPAPLVKSTRPVDNGDLPADHPEEAAVMDQTAGSKPADNPDSVQPADISPTGVQNAPPAAKPAVTVVQPLPGALRYYLIALLGLSVAILLMLSVLVFKKGTFAGKEKKADMDMEDRHFDQKVAAIDERINQKLESLDQNLRARNR
jgi:hypothetical protein